MAETPSKPPGWPFNELPSTDAPQPVPPSEPPPVAHPLPPAPSAYEPPAPGYQPPPPAPGYQPPPPAPGYQPPPPAPAPAPAPGYQPPPAPAPGYQPPPPAPGYQPPPPAPGYSGDAPFVPPPPSSSSKRTVWITIAVIVGIVLIGIAGCTAWFVNTITAPVDESNRFLAEVDAGDYDAAVARIDSSCNRAMTAAGLDEIFGGNGIDYNLNNSQIVNSSASVSGTISSADGRSGTITFSLFKNGDQWQICDFTISG